LWLGDFARVEGLNVTRFGPRSARTAIFLAKPAKHPSVNRLFALDGGILPSGTAIRKQNIAIPKGGIAIPIMGITVPRPGIGIPSQRMAIPE
jgi:hypothetical protein